MEGVFESTDLHRRIITSNINRMKIVISPAKSLNLDKELPTSHFTEASFLKQAETILKTLKKKNPKQLMTLKFRKILVYTQDVFLKII